MDATGDTERARFREPADTVPQAWDRLAVALAAAGHRLTLMPPPRQFAGGFGNLNYRLEIDERPYVLRRPPLGPIPPGANDMRREHLVLSHLAPRLPLVPKPLMFCDDPVVLGAPFLIMEYRPGLVIGGTLPAGYDSAVVGPHLSRLLVDVLSDLHAVPPSEVGLDTFGKPDGFLARAIDGWSKRAEIALDGSPRPSALDEVIRWLRTARIPAGDVTLLHNDFKLDNVVLDPETLSPSAVLDWDMGSRGDPLFDLATLLSYWTEADDPPGLQRLGQMPTAAPGFWRRAEVVAAYAERTGRDVGDFRFYRILTMFKLAVVFLQIEARGRTAPGGDPRQAAITGLGLDLLDLTRDIVRGNAS